MPPPTLGNDTIRGTDIIGRLDQLTGLAGDDYINAGAGDDFIFEGEFNWGGGLIDMFGEIPELTIGELVNFGAGNDILDGGDGFDELNYFGYTRPVYMNFATGIIEQNGERDIFRNIEWVVLSDADDVVITNENAFGVTLQAGDDLVVGFIDIGESHGGTGIDTIDCSEMAVNFTINAPEGTSLIEGGFGSRITGFEIYIGSATHASTIITDDVESTVIGGAAGDIFTGGAGDDVLRGNDGADRLTGNGGDDVLGGGRGADVITDMAGANRILGSDGRDQITSGGAGSSVSGGNGRDRIDVSGANSSVSGGASADTITLGAGAVGSEVEGGNGDDEIMISAANISLDAGRGADDALLESRGISGSLGAGEDTGRFSASASESTLRGGGGADRITLLGEGNRALGNNGNDTLIIGTRGSSESLSGSAANGGNGDDRLYVHADAAISGGNGDDIFHLNTASGTLESLSGGRGADEFNFNEFGQNTAVTIEDFDLAEDRLDIRGITGTADLASLANTNGQATLTFRQTSESLSPGTEVEITLTLEGLRAAEITDDIFL